MTSPAARRRQCPSCAASFTPHRRKPSQIYCCERCRHAGHRRRQRELTTAARPSSRTSSPSPAPSSSRDEAPNGAGDRVRVAHLHIDPNTSPGNENPTDNNLVADEADHVVNDDVVNEVQHCPHCRQPIALVTLLLTPTAAHVTVPDPPTAAAAAKRRRPGPT